MRFCGRHSNSSLQIYNVLILLSQIYSFSFIFVTLRPVLDWIIPSTWLYLWIPFRNEYEVTIIYLIQIEWAYLWDPVRSSRRQSKSRAVLQRVANHLVSSVHKIRCFSSVLVRQFSNLSLRPLSHGKTVTCTCTCNKIYTGMIVSKKDMLCPYLMSGIHCFESSLICATLIQVSLSKNCTSLMIYRVEIAVMWSAKC